MKLKRALAGALSAAMTVSLLTGCSSSSSGNSVVVNLGSEPPEMLSFLCTDSTSGNVLRHVVEGLVTLDENNEAVPGVAKEVPTKENGGISEDGKTITFKLNDKAKWSNGDPVTAQDFEFAFDQLFIPSNGASYASTWSPLIVGADDLLNSTANVQEDFVTAGKGVYEEKDGSKTFKVNDDAKKEYEKAVKDAQNAALEAKGWHASEDGKEFTVELTGPYVYFVNLMSFYNFAPVQEKAYKDGGGLDDYGNDAEGFLGNGPFKFKEWNHDDSIVLEKNEEYWNADEIKLDEIEFKMITDNNTLLNEFENGTIDMIGLTGEQATNLTKDGKNVQSYSDGSVWYFEFNHKVPGLNNKKVRKALSIAYDVDTYIKTVKGDQSTAATSYTAPSTRAGEFTKAVEGVVGDAYKHPTDFTEAKKLLEEGLAEENLTMDTFKISILGDSGEDALKNYAFFQEQWKKNLGLEVEIEQVEFKTRIARMQSHDFDIVFAGWSADYDDPMSYLDLWLTGGGNNHGEYSNPAYDAAINAALVEGDSAKRDEYLLEAEKIIAEDYPIGVIYDRQRSYICSDRLKGVVRTAFSDIDLRYAEVSE